MQWIIDALPCPKRAQFLAKKLKTKLCESLEYLIEFNKISLGTSYAKWIALLEKIKAESKVSSLFYALNSYFIEATNTQKIDTLQSATEEFFEIPTLIQMRFFHFQTSVHHKFKNTLFQKYIIFDLPPEAEIFDPDPNDVVVIQDLVTKALQLIKSCDTSFYEEMLEYVNEFMIFKLDALKAGTSFNLFGMIYIDTKNAHYSVINMVDVLIHETAHLYLYSLGVEDSLVLNEYEDKFFSPIKNKDRPMLGVYHAAFVLTRVVQFLKLLKETKLCTSTALREVNSLIEKYTKMAFDSFKIVQEHGILTSLGQQIIHSAAKEIQFTDFLTENIA